MSSVPTSVPPEFQHASRVVGSREIISSVFLQQLVYYHFYYSIAYAVMQAFVLRVRYLRFSSVFARILTPILYGIWVPLEFVRLYQGYAGNIKESTASLATFIFLTAFPQLFIAIYMFGIQDPILPFDRIWGIIQFCALLVELCIAWRTAGKLIEHKTARFGVEFGLVEDNGQREEETALVKASQDETRLEDETLYEEVAEEENDENEENEKTTKPSAATREIVHRRPAQANRSDPRRELQPSEPSMELNKTQPLPGMQVNQPKPVQRPVAHSKPAPATVSLSSIAPLNGPANQPIPASAGFSFAAVASTAHAKSSGLETAEQRIARRLHDRAIIRGEVKAPKSTRNRNPESMLADTGYYGQQAAEAEPVKEETPISTATNILQAAAVRRKTAEERKSYLKKLEMEAATTPYSLEAAYKIDQQKETQREVEREKNFEQIKKVVGNNGGDDEDDDDEEEGKYSSKPAPAAVVASSKGGRIPALGALRSAIRKSAAAGNVAPSNPLAVHIPSEPEFLNRSEAAETSGLSIHQAFPTNEARIPANRNTTQSSSNRLLAGIDRPAAEEVSEEEKKLLKDE